MDLRLSGGIAVVTGASKGIGLAVTRTLLQEGARVVATSRRRTPELDALDGELLHVAADLMEPGAPAHVIARAVEHFGGLDILVNNAGGPPPGTKLPQFGFLDLSDDGWHAMLEFNLLSAVRRLATPQEIADAVVLLASPRSASTTGTQVVVDASFLKAS